jgi:signal transduction histidine kinase
MSRAPGWLAGIGLVLLVAAARVVQYRLDLADHDPPLAPALIPAVVIASALPLLWRDRYPFAVLRATAVGELALLLLDLHGVPFALLIAMYAVGAATDRGHSLRALCVFAAATTVAAAFEVETPAVVVMAVATLVMAWALGALQNAGRRYAAEASARLALLERERETRAELAASEERARIARELHDVVAHGVSVMTMHAAGARLALDSDPSRARRAIAEVERTGRRSLSELRRLLGLLDRDDATELDPQPGLSRLDELVAQFRRADLPVTVAIQGEPRELPAGVDLSAFRIIQEALTNAAKHAGRAPVEVTLRYRDASLGVEVLNAPNGNSHAVPQSGAGRGLIGMRERVALHGGRFSAAPAADGGFRVECELPLGA